MPGRLRGGEEKEGLFLDLSTPMRSFRSETITINQQPVGTTLFGYFPIRAANTAGAQNGAREM